MRAASRVLTAHAGEDVCGDAVRGLIQAYPEMGDMPCVCLVFRHAATADGLSDYGFPATERSCIAYRALYPEDFDCVVDRDWHTLP